MSDIGEPNCETPTDTGWAGSRASQATGAASGNTEVVAKLTQLIDLIAATDPDNDGILNIDVGLIEVGLAEQCLKVSNCDGDTLSVALSPAALTALGDELAAETLTVQLGDGEIVDVDLTAATVTALTNAIAAQIAATELDVATFGTTAIPTFLASGEPLTLLFEFTGGSWVESGFVDQNGAHSNSAHPATGPRPAPSIVGEQVCRGVDGTPTLITPTDLGPFFADTGGNMVPVPGGAVITAADPCDCVTHCKPNPACPDLNDPNGVSVWLAGDPSCEELDAALAGDCGALTTAQTTEIQAAKTTKGCP